MYEYQYWRDPRPSMKSKAAATCYLVCRLPALLALSPTLHTESPLTYTALVRASQPASVSSVIINIKPYTTKPHKYIYSYRTRYRTGTCIRYRNICS